MKRFLTIAVLCISALSLWADAAFAAEVVKVRSGEHDSYSRVVLEWPSVVTYETERAGDHLAFTFNKAGTPNQDILTAAYVGGMKILETDPLQVAFFVPPNVDPRHFMVGNRLVIDFYAPPGSQRAAAPATQSAPQPAAAPPKAEEPKTTPNEQQQEAMLKEALEDEAQVMINAAPPPPVLKASDLKPHQITLAATESIGLAVFHYAGSLWLAMDKPDLPIRPQIDGPNTDQFYPVEDIAWDSATLFRMNKPAGAHIGPDGGDLLWQITISPDDQDAKPLAIERNVRDGAVRGGTVRVPFTAVSEILEGQDPVTGTKLIIVTSDAHSDYAGPALDFVDFSTIESAVGLVIRPKTPDLSVKKINGGIEISRPGGLALSSQQQMKLATASTPTAQNAQQPAFTGRRIYDFEQWQMGGLNALDENKVVIMAGMNALTEGGRVEELINLAKMQLANGRGAEALGFLRVAGEELPTLLNNPRFIALRGAAKAFDWRTEEAFEEFSNPVLENYEEIQYWRAFVLADLGDWQQAIDVMPNDFSVLEIYPPEVRNRLAPVLAEIALRGGNVDQAERLFEIAEQGEDTLNMSHAAALDYLRGEAARQRGDIDETIERWDPLAEGRDPLYRAKAGLALTRLLTEERDLPVAEAIDRLERLRYAWRGDNLEGQVNYWLGRTYIDADEHLKGLRLLRDAIVYTDNQDISDGIAREMRLTFAEFFKGPELAEASPIAAAELYENFQELTPSGADGDLIVAALAERMVDAGLYMRADNLMSHQLDHRLSGEKALKMAMRLSAVRLLQDNPQGAQETLGKAEELLLQNAATQGEGNYKRDIALMRARAFSQTGRSDQALELLRSLPPGNDTHKLKADISWNAGFWDDAAEALNDVILDENISFTRPLTDAQTALILQRAIALNLASDRIALANLRERYTDLMNQSEQARLFDVVTRPRQNIGLADRETMLSLTSEVDLFGEFLESYRAFDQSMN